MLTKEKLIDTINQLPEKFTLDEVIDRIILLEKIEIGLQQIERSEVIADEDLRKHLGKWLD